MHKTRAGQASVELIAVLGVALLSLLIFTVLSTDLLSGISSQKKYQEAREGVQKLAFAADSVFAQGEGASETVKLSIPPGTTLNPEKSYIGRPASAPSSIPPNTINLNIGGTDVFATTKAPVSGALPSSIGVHMVKVTSKGSYVAIGQYFFDIDKQSVFKSMARDETRQEAITFSAQGATPVVVNISYAQPYGNAVITLSQTSFVLTSGEPAKEITLTFETSDKAAGIYNWELVITAASQGGAAETMTLPVTLDVQV